MSKLLQGYSDDELATIEHYLEGVAALTADSISELSPRKR
jgi:hypothetical protein